MATEEHSIIEKERELRLNQNLAVFRRTWEDFSSDLLSLQTLNNREHHLPVEVQVNGRPETMYFFFSRDVVSPHKLEVYTFDLLKRQARRGDKGPAHFMMYFTFEPHTIKISTSELLVQSELRGNGLGRAILLLNNDIIEKIISLGAASPDFVDKTVIGQMEDDATIGESPRIRTQWTTHIAEKLGYQSVGGKLLRKVFRP